MGQQRQVPLSHSIARTHTHHRSSLLRDINLTLAPGAAVILGDAAQNVLFSECMKLTILI